MQMFRVFSGRQQYLALRANTKTVGIRILRVKLDYAPRVLVVVDELTIFSGKTKVAAL